MVKGTIDSQEPVGVLEMVTKSAVKNRLATPSSSRMGATNGSVASAPLTYVPGPPTGIPTVNFIAFGFGVGSVRMDIGRRA